MCQYDVTVGITRSEVILSSAKLSDHLIALDSQTMKSHQNTIGL